MEAHGLPSGPTSGELTFDQALGQVLQEEREHRGLTIEDLVAGIIDIADMERIESGSLPINAGELVFIAARLRTDVNYLLSKAQREIHPPVSLWEPKKLSSQEMAEILSDENCIVLELYSRGWTYREIAAARGYKSAESTSARLGHLRNQLHVEWDTRGEKLIAWVNQQKSDSTPLGKRIKKLGEGLGEKPVLQLNPINFQDLPTDLGKRIRAIRVARGLTQSDLAGDSYTLTYISRLENGHVALSTNMLPVFATRLNISVEEFLGGKTIEEITPKGYPADEFVVTTAELGSRVRELRKIYGYNQLVLARELGLGSSVITNIENQTFGTTKRSTVESLAGKLKVPTEELLNGGPTVDRILEEHRTRQEAWERAEAEKKQARGLERQRKQEERERARQEREAERQRRQTERAGGKVTPVRKRRDLPVTILSVVARPNPKLRLGSAGLTVTQLRLMVLLSRGWTVHEIASFFGLKRVGPLVFSCRNIDKRLALYFKSNQDLGEWTKRMIEVGDNRLCDELRRVDAELKDAAKPTISVKVKPTPLPRPTVVKTPAVEKKEEPIFISQRIIRRADEVSLGQGLRTVVSAIPKANFSSLPEARWISRYSEQVKEVKRSYVQVVRARYLPRALRSNVLYLGRLLWDLPKPSEFIENFDQAMRKLRTGRGQVENQLGQVLERLKKESVLK